MLYSCDKFVKKRIDYDGEYDRKIVSNISPIIGLPKSLGEEITIHLAYKINDGAVQSFDKTFTAVQDGETIRWSETGGMGSMSENSYVINCSSSTCIYINFTKNYFGGAVDYDDYDFEVTEFSINGIPVTQRE